MRFTGSSSEAGFCNRPVRRAHRGDSVARKGATPRGAAQGPTPASLRHRQPLASAIRPADAPRAPTRSPLIALTSGNGRPTLLAMKIECAACSMQNRLPAARLQDRARCAACKAPLLPISRPIAVNSVEDFDELLRDSKTPLLVDFWAGWCGAVPSGGARAGKNRGSKGGSRNRGEGRYRRSAGVEHALRYSQHPTVVLFRAGKEAKRISGAMSASAMVAQLGL